MDMPAIRPRLVWGRAGRSRRPTGTITVRVVRESIGNNIVGQQVTVTVNGETKKAVTDEQGRAEFAACPRAPTASRRRASTESS